MAAPLLTPLTGWSSDKKLENWAKNLTYSTENLTWAKNAEEVKKIILANKKIKVLGTRHCFNTIADSKDGFLSVSPEKQAFVIDSNAKTVKLSAAIKYGELAPTLHEKGYALHNLASLPHISIGGACATATHGSGEKQGNLATAVREMEIVRADGETVVLNRDKDGEKFNAAVVHLGALGAVTEITLDIQPTFLMNQYVYENLPLTELKKNFDAIEGSGYSVSLFTNWAKDDITEVWIKSKVDDDKIKSGKEFYGATLAKKHMHPIPELSAENCTDQMGVAGPWYERMPHFKMGFTPSSGKELQTEYFVPRKNAVDAILAISKMGSLVSPHLFTSEIRTIAADNFWMSPCYKQDSVAIHFTWKQDWPSVSKLLPVIEKELAPFNARPHWGKLFTVAPAKLQSLYTKHGDFMAEVKKYDPAGKFRNDFLSKNLY